MGSELAVSMRHRLIAHESFMDIAVPLAGMPSPPHKSTIMDFEHPRNCWVFVLYIDQVGGFNFFKCSALHGAMIQFD